MVVEENVDPLSAALNAYIALEGSFFCDLEKSSHNKRWTLLEHNFYIRQEIKLLKLPEEEITKRMEIKTADIARFRVTLHTTKLFKFKLEKETQKNCVRARWRKRLNKNNHRKVWKVSMLTPWTSSNSYVISMLKLVRICQAWSWLRGYQRRIWMKL